MEDVLANEINNFNYDYLDTILDEIKLIQVINQNILDTILDIFKVSIIFVGLGVALIVAISFLKVTMNDD